MNWHDLTRRWHGRPHSLRVWLTGLVLATLLPTLVAGAFALWRTSASYRDASDNRLADMARTLAHAIERDLAAKSMLVDTLTAPTGGAAGVAGLQEWLDGARVLPGAVVVAEASAALDALPADAGQTAGGLPVDTARTARRRGQVALSNLFGDPPRVAIVAHQPVRRGTEATQLVAVVVPPRQLVSLAPQDGPDGQSLLVAVTDGVGRVVARSRDADIFVGRRVPDWSKVAEHAGDHGLFEARTTEGLPVKFAFQRLRGTPGWVVVAGEPLDSFNAGWRRLQTQLLMGGALAVVFALLLAAWVARRVLRPVATLAQEAQLAAGRGRALAEDHHDSAVTEFAVLRERIANAQAALQQRADDARRNAQALAVSERRYRRLAEAGALVLWRSTQDGRLIAATGWESLTGQPEGRALGFGWLGQVFDEDRAQVTAALGELASGEREIDVEFRLLGADGTLRWVRVRGAFVAPDGDGDGAGEWVGALEDVDERRSAQARVAHLAHHDPLTQLPNRTRLRERLIDAIAQVQPEAEAAVLCIDLDRFKEVNDTLGHPAGDALLVAVAQRLRHVVRDGDTVARMGGDEFAVVQTRLATPRDAEVLAERIVMALAAPYDLDGHQVSIGASVGISIAATPEAVPGRLMAQADMALYAAKQGGRGVHRLYGPDMDVRLAARRATGRELAEALARGEFEVSYEPVRHVTLGTVCGFEAKVHWRHPQRGSVALDEVSGVADEIGVLRPLADWVLQQACRDAAGWPGALRVAVDITAGQLADRDFPGVVAAALAIAGLPPARLELEVNEAVLADGRLPVIDALHRLKGLGVRVAVDHFGSSGTALGALRNFPFDKVKLEEALVRDIGRHKEGDALVRSLTALCDALGIAPAAAGVTDERQLAALADESCVEAQGPRLGQVLRAADLRDWLAHAETAARGPAPSA